MKSLYDENFFFARVLSIREWPLCVHNEKASDFYPLLLLISFLKNAEYSQFT